MAAVAHRHTGSTAQVSQEEVITRDYAVRVWKGKLEQEDQSSRPASVTLQGTGDRGVW